MRAASESGAQGVWKRLGAVFLPGAYHTLWNSQEREYAEHLRRLPNADRRRRFHRHVSNIEATAHAASVFANQRAEVVGWFQGGVLRGAAEIVFFDAAGPNGEETVEAEAAFAVEPKWQGRGVGAGLMHRAALHARNAGAVRLHIATETDNRAMLHVADEAGVIFEVEDRDAEGVLRSEPRTVASICLQTLEEEVGLVAWGWELFVSWLLSAPRRVWRMIWATRRTSRT